MSEYMMYTPLCNAIGIPANDANIALAYTPYQADCNKRMYRVRDALAAMDAYYDSKFEFNKQRYRQYGSPVFKQRALRAKAYLTKAYLTKVRTYADQWRAEMENEKAKEDAQ